MDGTKINASFPLMQHNQVPLLYAINRGNIMCRYAFYTTRKNIIGVILLVANHTYAMPLKVEYRH
jgi:hypothetical protein